MATRIITSSVPALPDPRWTSHQAYWSIDPVNGNDSNAGWGDTAVDADARPLRTLAEWVRRFQGATISQICQVRILGDLDEDVWIGGINSPMGGQDAGALNSFVALVGVPTVLHTGTLTAVQAQSGNTRGYLEDTALPTSWTASGLVSGKSTPRLIRSTSTNRKAWILKDVGSKRAQIDTPVSVSFTVQAQIGSGRSEFVNGEGYEVVTFPKIKGVRIAPGLKFRAYGVHVQSSGGAQICSWQQCGPTFVLSWLESITAIGDGIGVWKCGISGSSSLSAANCYFVNSTAFGDASDAVLWVYHSSLTSSGDNVVFGTRLRLDHSTLWDNGENATSNWAIWDGLIRAVLVNVSTVRFDTLVGAGSADYVIYSDYAAGVNMVCGGHFSTGWTATSGAAKPIAIGGTWNYADLPTYSAADGWGIRGAA